MKDRYNDYMEYRERLIKLGTIFFDQEIEDDDILPEPFYSEFDSRVYNQIWKRSPREEYF